MDVAVRIRLGIDVGMGREQDSEFHARLAPQSMIPKSADFSNRIMFNIEVSGAPSV
jgi:hypothetical protein